MNLLIFPDEILLEIFSYFKYNELLKLTICKKIRNLNLCKFQLMKLYQITLLPERNGYIKNIIFHSNMRRTIRVCENIISYNILLSNKIKVEFSYDCKSENIVAIIYKNEITLGQLKLKINESYYQIELSSPSSNLIIICYNHIDTLLHNTFMYNYFANNNLIYRITSIVKEDTECVELVEKTYITLCNNLDNKIIGYLEYHYAIGFKNAMKKHIIYNIKK